MMGSAGIVFGDPQDLLEAVLADVRFDEISVAEDAAIAGTEPDGDPFLVLAIRAVRHHLATASVADDDLFLNGFGSGLTHGFLLSIDEINPPPGGGMIQENAMQWREMLRTDYIRSHRGFLSFVCV